MVDRDIGGQKNRVVQVRAVQPRSWTKAQRKRFLDTLASTCNVSMAARAAGKHPTSPYKLRAHDLAFRALWEEALSIGYERLEAAVLRRALVGVNAIEIEGCEPDEQADSLAYAGDLVGEQPMPVVGSGVRPLASTSEVQLALAVLNRQRVTVDGRKLPDPRRRRATEEETDAALKKALDGLAKRVRKTPE